MENLKTKQKCYFDIETVIFNVKCQSSVNKVSFYYSKLSKIGKFAKQDESSILTVKRQMSMSNCQNDRSL